MGGRTEGKVFARFLPLTAPREHTSLMRSGVASLLAAGVLALGAVPTTLALADEDTTKKAAGRDAAGPPGWAPAHGHDKARLKGPDKRAGKAQALTEKRRLQASWDENREGPPPWAKAFGKQGDKAEQKRAHVAAMKRWTACVAAAEAQATEAEQRDAKQACEKPTPPGRARTTRHG